MTTVLATHTPHIAPMSPEAIDKVRRLEASLMGMPQVVTCTEHLFHGGMYARTIRIPAGAVLTGALIKLSTVLIVNGDCTAFTGSDTMELRGYHVIPGSAVRKQVFLAHTDTCLTMIFPSKATTVPEAEAEFTDEGHLLLSRQCADLDSIIVTGE